MSCDYYYVVWNKTTIEKTKKKRQQELEHGIKTKEFT
jgi:hypothetical protein